MGTTTEENPDQIPLNEDGEVKEEEPIREMKFYLFTQQGSYKIIQTKWG